MPRSMEEILHPEPRQDLAPLELKIGLLGRIQYGFYLLLYGFQTGVTTPIRVVLRLVLRPWKSKREGGVGDYFFPIGDSRLARWSLKVVLRGNAALNVLAGHHEDRAFYEKLLGWEQKVPVQGFGRGDLIRTLEEVGAADDDGSRPANLHWISQTTGLGRFLVVEKLHDGVEVHVRCVWLSGKFAGRVFTIGPDYSSILHDEEKDAHLPIGAYVPPKFATLGFQLLVSAAALAEGFRLIRLLGGHAWKAVEETIQKIFG